MKRHSLGAAAALTAAIVASFTLARSATHSTVVALARFTAAGFFLTALLNATFVTGSALAFSAAGAAVNAEAFSGFSMAATSATFLAFGAYAGIAAYRAVSTFTVFAVHLVDLLVFNSD